MVKTASTVIANLTLEATKFPTGALAPCKNVLSRLAVSSHPHTCHSRSCRARSTRAVHVQLGQALQEVRVAAVCCADQEVHVACSGEEGVSCGTEDMPSVATEDMSSVALEDVCVCVSSSLYLYGASCVPRGNSFTNRPPHVYV